MSGRSASSSAARSVEPAAVPQLAPLLAAGGPRLADLLALTEHRIEEIARGHGEELGEQASLTLSAGGKRMRPLLVLLCAGGSSSDGLVAAATAVELLHMATLVHDDVLDRAPLRRGRPTVYVAAGRKAATATGDFLFSRAFAELAASGEPEAVRALSDAASALARGELIQRADAWSPTVSVERYLERCRLKTGRLFLAACRLGALLGAPGRDGAEPFGRYGESIGVAFQILDDVLDVAGPAERTGKHRGTDLLDGTVTLPLIVARERDPAIAGLDLRAVTEPAHAAEVCDRIAATGALEESRRRALEHVTEARRILAGLEIDGDGRHALELVADGVVERYA